MSRTMWRAHDIELPSQTPHSSRNPLRIKGLGLAMASYCEYIVSGLCHHYLQSKPCIMHHNEGAACC